MLALVAGLGLTSLTRAGLTDFSGGLLNWVEKRFGGVAVQRLQIWRGLVRQIGGSLIPASAGRPTDPATIQRTLNRVNRFFNQVPYQSDQELWGVPDYWATPVEMLGIDGGDCEDYAIAKYLTLKDLGIPIDRLRISYVRALTLGESHMVLAYYATPDADPLILDNLMNDIRPASARSDLEPVFSFNDDDLWAVAGGAGIKGGGSQVRLWRELVAKLERERKM